MEESVKPVRCGCGGEGLLDCWLGDLDRDNLYYVYCDKCDIRTAYYHTEAEAVEAWNKAVSAKPEIIHCKDCKYYEEDVFYEGIIAAHHGCHKWGGGICATSPDGYCHLGERGKYE